MAKQGRIYIPRTDYEIIGRREALPQYRNNNAYIDNPRNREVPDLGSRILRPIKVRSKNE